MLIFISLPKSRDAKGRGMNPNFLLFLLMPYDHVAPHQEIVIISCVSRGYMI